eukprot:jgi/Ulvmu1/8875/UM049_0057.1
MDAWGASRAAPRQFPLRKPWHHSFRVACLISTLLAIHLVGLALFFNGFLLSRTSLNQFSTADDPIVTFDATSAAVGRAEARPFDRAIIMVIDALRLDFVKAQPYSRSGGGYVEIMPGLQQLVEQLGPSGVLAAFPADPPTTTMQRVKALLTGSLPTFLDVGSVFAGGEIREDNVLLQAMRSGMRVGAVGDDTWTQLFPPSSHAALNLSHPYPSLNVRDLDTVDDGVAKELRGGLLEDADWDILVAHYLGVDHAGHSYAVESPQMKRKVTQMDAEITAVFERLVARAGPGGEYERTLLLVFGDHGQTGTGDHGGGSPEEVDTPLFAVNLAAAAARRAADGPPLSAPVAADICDIRRGALPVVEQLDFAASLSALLGLPLPFENVGKVHPHLWSLAPESRAAPASTCACLPHCIAALSGPTAPDACSTCGACLRTYTTRISANAKQVHAYLAAYAATPLSSVSPDSLAHLAALIPRPASPAEPPPTPGTHAAAALSHLATAADIARSQWTQFHTPSAIAGLAVLALGTLLTAGALHAALFLRSLQYTRIITAARSFFGLSCPPVSSLSLLPPPALVMLGLLAARAAIPFSNSLVLAEAQVTQYLVISGVLVLAAAALSRAVVVRRSLSHAGHQLPPRVSPAVSAAVAALSLRAALASSLCLVPPPSTQRIRSQNVEPAADGPAGGGTTLLTLSIRGARLSVSLSRDDIQHAVRLGVAALCGAVVVSTSSWLLRNLCFVTIVLQMFFTHERRVIGVAWSITSALLALAHLPDPAWLLPSSVLILCNTLSCMHALWTPTATSSVVWSPLGMDRGTSAVMHIALYGAVACWSCMSLIHGGAIDRIGASPFDKAAEPAVAGPAEAAAAAGGGPGAWWDGVVAQAAPALVALALLSHHTHLAVHRAIAVPGTVQRFGTHVPWFKFFGDVVLMAHRILQPFGLMSDAQTLLVLLSLDNEDIEEQEVEAHARHRAPDPGGDDDAQNLLGDSQRAARLRRRRMFLRSQPFFWQPHGQDYRRAGGRLLLRAAVAHALLAALSVLFLLRACLSWRHEAGAPPLGEQSFEQLWRRPLPQQAPQWMQGMLLLFVQQVSALAFAFAYGIWRVPRVLIRTVLLMALGPVPGGVLAHVAARIPGCAPITAAVAHAAQAVEAAFSDARTAPLALVTPRLIYVATSALAVAAVAVPRAAGDARTAWARCFMDSRLTEQAAIAPPSSFHSARGMAMEFGEGVWDLVRDFTADSNARGLAATDTLLLLLLACMGPLWLVLLPARAAAIALHMLVLVLCVLGVLHMHWWVELSFDRLVLFAADIFRAQNPGHDIPFTFAPGVSAFTGTLLASMMMCLLPHAAFFGSGHYCEFAGVQWPAAFVGFTSSDPPWRSGLLIALNTFLPHAAVAVLVLLVATREGRGLMHSLDSAAAEGHVLQLPNRIPREQIHAAAPTVQAPLGAHAAAARQHGGSGPPLPLSSMRRRAASATPSGTAHGATVSSHDDDPLLYSVDPSLPEGSNSIAEALELARPGPGATLWDRAVLLWIRTHTRLVAHLSGLGYLEACNSATPPQTLSTTRQDVSLFDASRTPQQWASAQLVHLVLLATLLLRLLASSLDLLCASLSAFIQRRHLMVWALFAPKWLFEVCFWGVAGVSLVVTAAAADGCVEHLLPNVWRRHTVPASTIDMRAARFDGEAAPAQHSAGERR